jgi:hypothetical protein
MFPAKIPAKQCWKRKPRIFPNVIGSTSRIFECENISDGGKQQKSEDKP